jgi:hypothetical protein
VKTVTQRLRDHLLNGAMSLEELQKSEWSSLFEQLMRNRLIMGAFRYGRLGAEGKPQFDRVAYIRKCLDKYEQTGNLECLVDVANLALVEFVEGKHPKRHFHTEEDGKEHAEVVTRTGWNGKCVLCGGPGPFRKPKDIKYSYTEVCAWCEQDPPVPVVLRHSLPKAKDGGPR